jgi:hypothetical protein
MMRKAETGASVRVIEVPGDRLAEAADLLARSFQANPNLVDLFPSGKVRARALVHVQNACLRDALGFRHVYAPIRDRGLVGVAPDMTPVLAAAPRSILRLVRFMAGVNKLHLRSLAGIWRWSASIPASGESGR